MGSELEVSAHRFVLGTAYPTKACGEHMLGDRVPPCVKTAIDALKNRGWRDGLTFLCEIRKCEVFAI